MSAVWDSLVENSKDLATQAAGTALDTYAKKLTASNESPAAPAPAKTIGDPSTKKWWIIGGIVAAILGLGVWFATRKGK